MSIVLNAFQIWALNGRLAPTEFEFKIRTFLFEYRILNPDFRNLVSEIILKHILKKMRTPFNFILIVRIKYYSYFIKNINI